MSFMNYGSKVYLTRAQTRALSLEGPVGDPFGGPAYGEKNDPVSAAVGVGASVVGGAMQADAAKSAARTQAKAADRATFEQARQFDLAREDLAPFREAGSDAVSRIRALLGLGKNTGSPDFGSLNSRFTMADFEADPVNQLGLRFGLDEGSKAIRRMFGASGMGRSGAAAKALTRFGEDYAGSKAAESRGRFLQDQDILFNRLSGVAGTGQTATSNTAALGAQTAQNIGQNIMGAANARGAASIAGANAIAGGLGNAANVVTTKYLLDGMRPNTVAPVKPMVAGQFNLDTYG